jgi:hypothetical protein
VALATVARPAVGRYEVVAGHRCNESPSGVETFPDGAATPSRATWRGAGYGSTPNDRSPEACGRASVAKWEARPKEQGGYTTGRLVGCNQSGRSGHEEAAWRLQAITANRECKRPAPSTRRPGEGGDAPPGHTRPPPGGADATEVLAAALSLPPPAATKKAGALDALESSRPDQQQQFASCAFSLPPPGRSEKAGALGESSRPGHKIASCAC